MKKIFICMILGVSVMMLCGCKSVNQSNSTNNKENIVNSEGKDIDLSVYKDYKYLPLGTIVKLKSDNKLKMIVGRLNIEEEGGRVYDYSACGYPAGIISSETKLFDVEDIESVKSLGYVDEDERTYNEQLIEYQKEHGKKDNYSNSEVIPITKHQENLEFSEENFLPLGTIVSLYEFDQKFIIIGRMPLSEEDNLDSVRDYIAFPYPNGTDVSGEYNNVTFDRENIEKILFIGYQDEFESAYNKKLIEIKKSL